MRRRALLQLALVAIAAACTEPTTPVDPVWGKQPCGSCGMIVGDRRYAAQTLAPNGQRVYFDDLGCMVKYIADRKIAPARMWVHEAHGDRWLDARAARYARGPRTPMDFGFEARADEGISYDAFSAEILQKSAQPKARRAGEKGGP